MIKGTTELGWSVQNGAENKTPIDENSTPIEIFNVIWIVCGNLVTIYSPNKSNYWFKYVHAKVFVV